MKNIGEILEERNEGQQFMRKIGQNILWWFDHVNKLEPDCQGAWWM